MEKENNNSNYKSLKDFDPEIYELIQKEQERQAKGIELIASENYTSVSVMECMGSVLTNKYSEGQVGARYYGGNEYIDVIEGLAKKRALEAFDLDEKKWGVNVQPYSGSPANFAVYTGILKPGDKIMGLDLPSGGHLTHGYKTDTRIISASSYYFDSKPYKVNTETGYIDYEEMKKLVLEYKPNLIICGFSAYSRDLDYKAFREAADSVGAFLMADIAHISGLVASKLLQNPFEYCDVVTTTTHKTLRGARGGIIFSKIDDRKLNEKIDFAVFPMCQGGPHNPNIAGIAAQLKEVKSEEFKKYSEQVIKNCRHLAKYLIEKGHKIATGGTDNHLFLLDLRPHGLTGSKMQNVFDMVSITLNKNSIAGDKSAISPGAVRIGLCAMTTRGLVEKDVESIGDYIHRTIEICKTVEGKTVKDFMANLEKKKADLELIRKDVEAFSVKFPLPGVDVTKFQ